MRRHSEVYEKINATRKKGKTEIVLPGAGLGQSE